MWHKFLSWGAGHYLRRQVRRRPPQSLADFDPGKVRRVLLLNATALGDLLFSTPALRALKETYPHWQLHLMVNPRFRELVAHNPYLSRLWLYPGRGLGLFRLMEEMRGQGYDLVIILHGNDPEATLIAWAAGAAFIIGSAKSPLSFAYGARVSHPDLYEHAVERRLDYVRLVGADTPERSLDLFVPPGEVDRAGDILGAHFGARPQLLVAFHPTGSAAYKWWPLASYVAVGEFLYERYQASFLIVSGAQDRAVAEALAAGLPGPSLVTGGRHSLLTVAALLSHCRLLVANDSGPLHMALALKVPSIALIGADHPARIGPYGVDWGASLHHREAVCPLDPCRLGHCRDNICLKAITVAEVTALIRDWWEPRFWAPRSAAALPRGEA